MGEASVNRIYLETQSKTDKYNEFLNALLKKVKEIFPNAQLKDTRDTYYMFGVPSEDWPNYSALAFTKHSITDPLDAQFEKSWFGKFLAHFLEAPSKTLINITYFTAGRQSGISEVKIAIYCKELESVANICQQFAKYFEEGIKSYLIFS